MELLELCESAQEADRAEAAHIAACRASGCVVFNVASGGPGSPGVIRSAETRQRQREAIKRTLASRDSSLLKIAASLESQNRADVRARKSASLKRAWPRRRAIRDFALKMAGVAYV
jgi:hypothetical protein